MSSAADSAVGPWEVMLSSAQESGVGFQGSLMKSPWAGWCKVILTLLAFTGRAGPIERCEYKEHRACLHIQAIPHTPSTANRNSNGAIHSHISLYFTWP